MAKRTRITRPYPTHSFEEALPIAETIQRVNGGQPVETELLAGAMGTSAKSSTFIQKLNASSKYGLTVGSYSDEAIHLTELGESVTAPGSAEERAESIIKAVTKPDIFREFYRIYAGKRMPEDIYASNTLARELGVPKELTEECLAIIRRNGLATGIVSDRRGVLVVGGIADSETAAKYHTTDESEAAPSVEIGAEGGDGDEAGPSSDTAVGGEILIVSEADDPTLAEVVGLVEGLVGRARWRLADLRATEGRILPEGLSEALIGRARGCVFIWPRCEESGTPVEADAKAWAALGAASYRLGERLAIVLSDGADDEELGIGTEAMVVRVGRADGESVYPKLMAALVRTGIVRVSVG